MRSITNPDPRSHRSVSNGCTDSLSVLRVKTRKKAYIDSNQYENLLWHGPVESFLSQLNSTPLFDLIITSPPYNLGKSYENPRRLDDYRFWQESIIRRCVERLKPTGSICWQVGNHVINGGRGRSTFLVPLDVLFHGIFESLELQLRNRIIWRFGHGLHCSNRFSGRYEVVLWYTKSNDYVFNLDAVRVPAKYPGKKHYKGPRAGQYSCNPRGKNPEDVWDIPNVKSNHVEKTIHPCQFPVALIERLVLALTRPGQLVFDPFAGVCSAGVAAIRRDRRFWGCEVSAEYIEVGSTRLKQALRRNERIRPLDLPVYDHRDSSLSIAPASFELLGARRQ